MKRMTKGAVSVALIALCAVLLLTATPVAAQITCTSPNSVYWSPPPQGGNGSDSKTGTTSGTAVATLPRAESLSVAAGGACIFLVIPGSEPSAIKQVYASTQPPGVPLATTVVYGLLFALAAALIGVGLWARRKTRLAPRLASQV